MSNNTLILNICTVHLLMMSLSWRLNEVTQEETMDVSVCQTDSRVSSGSSSLDVGGQ